jgi:hypothetical protein
MLDNVASNMIRYDDSSLSTDSEHRAYWLSTPD